MSEYDKYWESEEFEDLVARSIIGMHETKVKKEKHAPASIKFNEDVFKRFKSIGCYFQPSDRIVRVVTDPVTKKLSKVQEVDILNDGLPNAASYSRLPPEQTSPDYLQCFYMERLPFLPRPFGSDINGKPFRITQMFFGKAVKGNSSIVVVDKLGNLKSCYTEGYNYDPITKRTSLIKIRPVMEKYHDKELDFNSVFGSFTLQIYQDRRYLWNVQAHDGIAKATFGVYPEQIQSLFYARDLPETSTGRKRPILHWVNSHQRRMKSGTEVDVEKYLRGTHEFVMNGTKFKITNPLKTPL